MNRKLLLLLCVSVPSFMINLDANIVAVSLSSIAHSLHADFASIEWVISAYVLAFASLLMPAGAFADRFGRKRILVLGLAIFTVASFFCGAAVSVLLLNVARAAQGIGAALLLSAALAVLSHEFHGKERAKAFAFWGSVIGIAVMLGPVAGGLITQSLGWQWAFYVNLPIGAAMIGLTLFVVEESKDDAASHIDLMGVVLFSGFLGLLTWALISGNREGWSSQGVLWRTGLAVLLFIGFVIAERRESRPMVDLSYFRDRTFLGANIAGITYPVTYLTMLTYLPFFFQSALHRTPLVAGLMMLPLAAPLFVVPRIVSACLDHRFSGRTLLSIGLCLVAAGLTLSSIVIGQLSYFLLLVPMFIASLGAGILNGQVPKVSMTVIPVERAGMASGIAGTVRFSGLVLGFAALGAVLFASIAGDIAFHFPMASVQDQAQMTRLTANGDFAAATRVLTNQKVDMAVLLASLARGYQTLLNVAAVMAIAAAALTWWLTDAAETAPHGETRRRAVNTLLD
ncbi:Drug resistance transporter, EmrB/QacA subfamily [Paraburkholderia sabiae]|uniref:MFS transporter n=1 Tax=Paraburkholderia sabiae TaxID=273251 RepID=UPI001CAAA934|nr:MFS transporter [Paraburkholderia sabiae]CAG9229823.1 Drug resistance transporter, EmrB/QacA subfamily [Paraburkholderia sabiae]